MENAGKFSEMALDRTSTTGGYERPPGNTCDSFAEKFVRETVAVSVAAFELHELPGRATEIGGSAL